MKEGFSEIQKDVFNNLILPKLSVEALVALSETCKYFHHTLKGNIDIGIKDFISRGYFQSDDQDIRLIYMWAKRLKNTSEYWGLESYGARGSVQTAYRHIRELIDSGEFFVDNFKGIHQFDVSFLAPQSPFDGHVKYRVIIRRDHPFSPPQIAGMSNILHPGYTFWGQMCLSYLTPEDKSPALRLEGYFRAIQSLLEWPNGFLECVDDSIQEPACAMILQRDPSYFYELSQMFYRGLITTKDFSQIFENSYWSEGAHGN